MKIFNRSQFHSPFDKGPRRLASVENSSEPDLSRKNQPPAPPAKPIATMQRLLARAMRPAEPMHGDAKDVYRLEGENSVEARGVSGFRWIHSDARRLADLAFVISTAPVTVPAVAAGAAALVAEGKVGNPIFTHWRRGLGGEPFKMYKLRTMPQHVPADSISTGAHDNNATRVGVIERKLTIDELLTLLINVGLLGNMAAFGIIPLVDEAIDEMRKILGPQRFAIWYRAYKRSIHGRISAFGNISPFLKLQGKDEQHTKQLREEFVLTRATLDVWLYENISPSLQLKILCEALGVGLGLIRDPSKLIGPRYMPPDYLERKASFSISSLIPESGLAEIKALGNASANFEASQQNTNGTSSSAEESSRDQSS